MGGQSSDAENFSATDHYETCKKLFGNNSTTTLDAEKLTEFLSDSEGLCKDCRFHMEGRVFALNLFIDSMKQQQSSPVTQTVVPRRSHHRENNPCNVSESSDELSAYSRRRISSPSGYYSDCDLVLDDGISDCDLVLDDGISGSFSSKSDYRDEVSEERKEYLRISKVEKRELVHMERVDGREINVVEGLELHTGVFNEHEQKNIVDFVYQLQRMGRRGQLRERTYSEPRKWMRGKGRVTIQFGCCYNYAKDKNGNPPGIKRDEKVDPLPSLFKNMIKRMVRWNLLPPTRVPDSCIVNIYEEGDCIPPHIDHHDFDRPFCTVSFLTQSNIMFGTHLQIISPGEFNGPVSISLPKGSVLILKGNGADVAKHCVPSVPAKRISITFRKMNDSKLPYKFFRDPSLEGIKPVDFSQFREEKKEAEGETQKRRRSDERKESDDNESIKYRRIDESSDYDYLEDYESDPSYKSKSMKSIVVRP